MSGNPELLYVNYQTYVAIKELYFNIDQLKGSLLYDLCYDDYQKWLKDEEITKL
jgi:hypothetical protein